MPLPSFNTHSERRGFAKAHNAYRGSAFSRLIIGALRKTADIIWPPRSLLSEERVERQGTIEIEKWLSLNFISGSKCTCCGIPLEESFAPDILCGACIAEEPIFDSARAPLVYDDCSKPLILALKHAGRKDGVRLMANLIKESCQAIENADLIIPVPLHPKRLWMRGFNQSAWLAQELAKIANKKYCPESLIRKRNTKSQNGHSFIGRRRNMEGAFAIKKPISGLCIILVDDVFTTGATVRSCSRTLKRAGAKRVDVVTLLRVNRPRTIEIDNIPIIDDAALPLHNESENRIEKQNK